MTAPTPTAPPSWPHCGHGADPATDPVGCRGASLPGRTTCLAHASAQDRAAYLAGLQPGDAIDHRGATITGQLLNELCGALRNPQSGHPTIGDALFTGATFNGDTLFTGATFNGKALFTGATFNGDTLFTRATFNDRARFDSVTFNDRAWFPSVTFNDRAWFTAAIFNGDAWFGLTTFSDFAVFSRAIFSDAAAFTRAIFNGEVSFSSTIFKSLAEFSSTRFVSLTSWGPLRCGGMLDLSVAVFEQPVTIEVAAAQVVCHRTRWENTATLRLRHATVDLTDTVLTQPFAVTGHPTAFTNGTGNVLDDSFVGSDPAVRVDSVRGVDAAHLVLTDIDLTACQFTGAFHLDQIRFAGNCRFAQPPIGWRGRLPWPSRWTRRRTLAEEHQWRAQAAGQPAPVPGQPLPPGAWRPGLHHDNPDRTPGPDDLVAVYRDLRKAFEDAKNEPGAADFYYGEMEMRRHDHEQTPRAERALLIAYWAVSGYGLRASRALAWLLAAMTLTVVAMLAIGLPAHDPQPRTTGTLTGGRTISVTTDTSDPGHPTGPLADRFTVHRAAKASEVVVNSVVFRSSGQNLTTIGTWIEMFSRLAEPTFLALAALAIRNRVKR
jgi:Pentapeptide repeats (9 copies)